MGFTDWCKAHPRFMRTDIVFVVVAVVLWVAVANTSPAAGMLIAFVATTGLISAIAAAAWLFAPDGRRAQ